jgi:hypothetical protein
MPAAGTARAVVLSTMRGGVGEALPKRNTVPTAGELSTPLASTSSTIMSLRSAAALASSMTVGCYLLKCADLPTPAPNEFVCFSNLRSRPMLEDNPEFFSKLLRQGP